MRSSKLVSIVCALAFAAALSADERPNIIVAVGVVATCSTALCITVHSRSVGGTPDFWTSPATSEREETEK